MILAFFKRFIIKYFTSIALEKIVIISLKELVKRTDSKVDDELFNAVFTQTNIEEMSDEKITRKS